MEREVEGVLIGAGEVGRETLIASILRSGESARLKEKHGET